MVESVESVEVDRRPRRVELAEEHRASLGFIGFTDRFALRPQAIQTPQQPAVGRVRPSDVPAAPPAILAESIEPSVVADPERGVALNVVAPETAKGGPPIEKSRCAGHGEGDGLAPFRLRAGERGGEGDDGGRGFWVEHGLGWAASGEING